MNINRVVLTTTFILLFTLFISLGMWQLRRADEKTAVHERFATHGNLSVLSTPIDSSQLGEYRYRRLEIRGRYLTSKQLLLDSMSHQGQVGYHVLTPFLPQHDSRWVLVNRGWVRADPDRRVLPQIDVSEVERVVRGRIDGLPRPGLKLAGSTGSDGWPQVALFPTFEEIDASFEEPLFHYQLLLDSGITDGFVRDWQPRVLAPERHVGYAIQWFSFAGVLVVMGIVLSVRGSARRA